MRDALKAARKALGPQARIAAAEGLARQLAGLPELSRPGHVAGYWAMDGELPLHAVMPRLADGARWCLPRLVQGRRLVFAPWSPGDPLEPNRYGIPEPTTPYADCLPPEALGVVLVPLVGFDRQGNRLGMGGGYYDRTFAFRKLTASPPLLVGIGYAMQACSAVPVNDWDVPMDLVATESELIDCRPARGDGAP